MIDRRQLKVYVDHAQNRLKRPRINFTLRGWDFIDGVLEGTWVNPVTGKLQPIPNSEEPDYQTSSTGRFAKLGLSEVDLIDSNSPAVALEAFSPDSGMLGFKCIGDNATGAGFITKTALPENQGMTATVYAYSQGTDQKGNLGEMFWADDQNLGGGGVGIIFTLDGKALIYKDDKTKPVYRASFEGGGYTPGTVRGGSYARATDQYVMFRVEVQDRFIVITSSVGGVVQFAAPWAIDRYNDDGTLFAAAEPVLPAKPWGMYFPTGAFTVVSSRVVYGFPNPYALSESYSFAEVPSPTPDAGDDAVDVLTGRVIPFTEDVTVTLVKEDGVTPYDRTTREFRAKVQFNGPAFLESVLGAYPRIAGPMFVPPGGPFDISDYVLQYIPFEVQDGTEGAGIDLIIRGDCPVDIIDEVELRPFRLDFEAHPDDPNSPPTITILDGVGDPPEFVDGFEPAGQSIRIRVWDRMRLLREAKWRETVVFDGLPLCCPPSDGESVVGICLREGGIRDSELVELPRIENEDGSLYLIPDTPSQRSGDFKLFGKARQLVEDTLVEAMEQAPKYAYGLRPRIDGTRAYVVNIEGEEPPVATFYRSPESGALDPEYDDNENGAWPLLYGPQEHRRQKLPKEGNVVRVIGRDPGTLEYLQAIVRDDASADPASPISPDKLGVPREVFARINALGSQAAVNAVARSLYAAVSARQYLHSWSSFLRILPDGSPLWRTDRVVLEGGMKDGFDATIRIASFSCDIRDENGRGLMDETGAKAPVSIRMTDYTGGALCGLGGATAWQIARRQRERVKDGGVSFGLAFAEHTAMGKANRLEP